MSSKDKKRTKAGKAIRIIAVVLVAALLLPMMIIEAGRLVTLSGNRIGTENGIDESIYVELCGQEQRVLVRGGDVSNPVVIWLHGGPGSPDTYVNYAFQRYLTDSYTFINWDQRGCGSTYYRNRNTDPGNGSAVFEQALSDLDALVEYARERFGKDKVVIAGHSYGTVLGSRYVALHPEKVAAYIGTGQAVVFNEKASFEHAREEAKKKGGDTSAMEEAFSAYTKEQNYKNIAALRAETAKYNKAERGSNPIFIGMFSPYMKINDLRWFMKPMLIGEEEYVKINEKLIEQCISYDAYEYGTEYGVPVSFISGSSDWICAAADSRAYYEKITAPHKSWHELESCGHTPQFDAPEEYARIFDAALKGSLAAI